MSPSLPSPLPPAPPFSFLSEWSGTCIGLITSVQLVSWQLIPTWEQQRERPRASQMMSAMCIKLLERQDEGYRVHRGVIDAECSPGFTAPVLVMGPAGSGLRSGSWTLLCPFLCGAVGLQVFEVLQTVHGVTGSISCICWK